MPFSIGLTKKKIIVIDDDPTGSQVVHSCSLLLKWDVETLRIGLRDSSQLLFLLADTRALSPDEAAQRNREIVSSLDSALAAEGLSRHHVLMVSRGDSTLRGHGFLEPSVLADCFGPFDATFHVPAFLEGGRTTINGMHFLHGVPIHLTPFAKDAVFGFSTSTISTWLQEKSQSQILSSSVQLISVGELNHACIHGPSQLIERMRGFNDNVPIVVDTSEYRHLHCFANCVLTLQHEKRFLFRSAASLLKALSNSGSQPSDPATLAKLRRVNSDGIPLPGLVMVGSYVPLADEQLSRLICDSTCVAVELPVRHIAQSFDPCLSESLLTDLEAFWLPQLKALISSGDTPVLFTSRGEFTFSSQLATRQFSRFLAQFMSRLAVSLVPDIGYLISKGGTTTQTLLGWGLNLSSVHLEGQLLPGISLVRSFDGPSRGLPIITFPGNLGDPSSLLQVWELLEAR